MFVIFRAVQMFCDSQHAAGLACPGRAMEQQVRHIFVIDELANYLGCNRGHLLVCTMSVWEIISVRSFGLYFSTKGKL